ncbi:class I SAM-dependent methyltransferase [Saccharothrix sp. HUAS TT1]|uniref:class I SAM-dependent methyltransferase n=1 Tax=unclassified Saccharothrix TaxID=2593673 RepID=UPI00345C1397
MPGVVIGRDHFLSGRFSADLRVDDVLDLAALDISAPWSPGEGDGRTVRAFPLDRPGASRLVRPAGGRTFVGAVSGRFWLTSPDASADEPPELIGPGELTRLPDEGRVVTRVSGAGDAEFVVLDVARVADVEEADDRQLPTGDLAPDYYYGYADRYEEVYRHGAISWETADPNDVLVSLLERNGIEPCRVIDLGCGEGRDSVYLADRGFEVLGVDVAHSALEKARQRARQRGVDATFIERDVTLLRGVPAESFDLAINMGCLHMIPDPVSRARHLSRVFEVLRPGGRFILAHCRENWLEGFWSVPDAESVGRAVPGRVIDRKIRTEDGVKLVPLVLVPYHESHEDELAAECEKAGFAVAEVLTQNADAFGNTAVLILERPR